MNEQIKQLQNFMKTTPLGVVYSGPVDGEPNKDLVSSTQSLQKKIQTALSNNEDPSIAEKAKNYTIMSGDSVSVSIADIQSMISKISPEKPKEEANKEVLAIQQIFNSNPFGIKYSGQMNGLVNPELIEKARALEQNISNITGASVLGKITDGKNIITTSSDLQKTFNLIKEYQEFLKTKPT